MNASLIIYLFAFLFGASWGSFLYTFIVRYTDGTYTSNPLYALTYPSHCPHCRETIKPVYLIPVFGYILAKGRCGVCGQPISFLYPIAEIASGCIAIASIYFFNWPLIPVYFIAITTSICIAIIDQLTMEIPNFLVCIIVITGIVQCIVEGQWLDHIYSALFMLAVFTLPVLIKAGGFGGGDIKFAAAIGLFLGFPVTIVALEIALVIGALYGIGFALVKSKTLKVHIPFGPFLSLGFIVSIAWGNDIVLLYQQL